MTPQERQLIDDLFDRLSKLENSPRDRDAEAAILEGLRRAPNAAYALVQTVLVQDEALKRANARIQELEGHGPEPQQSGGFLDSMRDAIFGQAQQGQPRGSVPSAGSRPVSRRLEIVSTNCSTLLRPRVAANCRSGVDSRASNGPVPTTTRQRRMRAILRIRPRCIML